MKEMRKLTNQNTCKGHTTFLGDTSTLDEEHIWNTVTTDQAKAVPFFLHEQTIKASFIDQDDIIKLGLSI